MNNQFFVNLQTGATAEDTANRTMQEVIKLVTQLNNAGLPIVIGPNDPYPESVNQGQTVIDYSSGTSVVKTWNGSSYV